ncbi:unnamed protein product [Urochloa humidicola]
MTPCLPHYAGPSSLPWDLCAHHLQQMLHEVLWAPACRRRRGRGHGHGFASRAPGSPPSGRKGRRGGRRRDDGTAAVEPCASNSDSPTYSPKTPSWS